MGRGLHSVEIKSEKILNDLLSKLQETEKISTKRAAILEVERKSNSQLVNIKYYLKRKYKLEDGFNNKELEKAQIEYLYNQIKNKTFHQMLYKCRDNKLIDMEESSKWLKKSNIKPRDEAAFCMMQDRNMFYGEAQKCPHCKTSTKTVDHLASRCNRMLYHVPAPLGREP